MMGHVSASDVCLPGICVTPNALPAQIKKAKKDTARAVGGASLDLNNARETGLAAVSMTDLKPISMKNVTGVELKTFTKALKLISNGRVAFRPRQAKETVGVSGSTTYRWIADRCLKWPKIDGTSPILVSDFVDSVNRLRDQNA